MMDGLSEEDKKMRKKTRTHTHTSKHTHLLFKGNEGI